jgi:hypothetical protein
MTSKRKPNMPDTVADAAVVLEEAYEDKVREQAQAHLDSSIETLAELAKGKDAEGEIIETTPATRRGAANDLIAHGFARDAGGQPDAGSTGSGRAGINIMIISHGDQPDVRVEHDVTPEYEKIEEEADAPDERRDRDTVHVSRPESHSTVPVRDDSAGGEEPGESDSGAHSGESGAVSRAYKP